MPSSSRVAAVDFCYGGSLRERSAFPVVVLTASLALLPGCAASFDLFQLDPADVARHGETAKAICVDDGEKVLEHRLYDRKLQLVRPEDTPDDVKAAPPNFRNYWAGPTRPPRLGTAYEPLFGIGLASISVGLLGSAVSALVFVICPAAEHCNEDIPAGTAIAGLGLAGVGAVLTIIGSTGDHDRTIGSGRLCDGVPPTPPTTPATEPH